MVVMAYAARVSDVQYTLDGRIYVETWGKVIDTVESEFPLFTIDTGRDLSAAAGCGFQVRFCSLEQGTYHQYLRITGAVISSPV